MSPNVGVLSIRRYRHGVGAQADGGKRERYELLLRKFAKRQAGAVDEIRTAIAATLSAVRIDDFKYRFTNQPTG